MGLGRASERGQARRNGPRRQEAQELPAYISIGIGATTRQTPGIPRLDAAELDPLSLCVNSISDEGRSPSPRALALMSAFVVVLLGCLGACVSSSQGLCGGALHYFATSSFH